MTLRSWAALPSPRSIGITAGLEVDFVLAKPLWGHGYAQEAMNAIIDHMTGLGLKRLAARLHAGNMRSEALLRRLHFQQDGLLRGHIERNGTRHDCKVFGLLL